MDHYPYPVSDHIPCETAVAPSPSEGRSVAERLRKPFSVVSVMLLVALIWLAAGTSSPEGRLAETTVGFLLAATAALGRMWCAMYIAGRKDSVLCVIGPYSLCRNPLYLFSSFGLLGIVLTAHRPVAALCAFVAFWCYHSLVIRKEELRLTKLFGSAYDDYCGRVPAVWPRLRGYVDDTPLTINLPPVLRAFSEVAWFLVAWLAVHLVFAAR